MRKLVLLMCVLAVNVLNAQDVFVKDTTSYEHFFGEAGVRIPLGAMADKYGVSPEFGFWYRTKLDNDMLDIGFSLFTPQGRKPFAYGMDGRDYILDLKAVSGMVGVRVNKVYNVLPKSYKTVEWISSLGYAFLNYGAPYKENVRESEDMYKERHTKAFSTFHLGQGVRYCYKNTGIQLQYNYTPYGMFSNYVPDNFGSHSLSFGVLYRQ